MSMPAFLGLIIAFLVIVIIFIISALPLHFAVKLLRGKTDLFKTIMVSIIAALIITALRQAFPIFGPVIAFLLLVWIYHELFRLKWWKAFLVWLVQLVIILLFSFLVGMFYAASLGISWLLSSQV